MSPKLKSMHSMRRQSVRIRSFAARMVKMVPSPVKLALSAAMRTKVMKEEFIKYTKNNTLKW
jgi:hypothetical protein